MMPNTKVLPFPVRGEIVCVFGRTRVPDEGGVWCSCRDGCHVLAPTHRCAGGCGALVTSPDSVCLSCCTQAPFVELR